MLKRWKKLQSKIRFENPWWTYKWDEFQIPGGIKGEYHYVHTNGSSMVIPILDDSRVLLVNQYRYLCERESLEFPCGSVKDGATYLETASHELREETGYTGGTLECIAEFNPYNGVTDEICRVFIARNLTPAEARPDETEEFELHPLSILEIDDLIANNEIWDGMTLSAWILAGDRLR